MIWHRRIFLQEELSILLDHESRLCGAGRVFALSGMSVAGHSWVVPAIRAARERSGPVLIDFKVEQEDSVYPIVPVGAHLKQMIGGT
jgi:thiamine pyrophosphate-dependent acetolactate synthase large subunit-like protein